MDITWHVNTRRRLLTQDSHNVLNRFPAKIDVTDSMLQIIDVVRLAAVCPGNPNRKFTELIEKRGGKLCGPKGKVVCVLDCTGEVTNHDGRVYGCTVRRSDCGVLLVCVDCVVS